MPFKSQAQKSAMYAAASGKSNISKKTAKKFIKHRKAKKTILG